MAPSSSTGLEAVEPAGLSGGGQHGGAEVVGQGRRREAEGGGAAPDQQALTGLQIQPRGEGAVGGLQGFRYGAQDTPGQ
jgi:hypothetical protein